MLTLGNSADNAATSSATDVTYAGNDADRSDLVAGDLISYYVTEYNSITAVESAPIWDGLNPAGYDLVEIDGQQYSITLPATFRDSEADRFRVYFKYWGNEGGVGTAAKTISFNEVASQIERIRAYEETPTGLSLVSDLSATDFAAGATLDNLDITKALVINALPVLAIDNARLIYSAQRFPNTSPVNVVWNDSLIMGDSGFNAASSNYRVQDAIPTIARYAPPGEPFNQPIPYFLNFASEQEDVIRGFQVVNDRLLVLCANAIHTVRYLPFNNLLASQQGRVKDTVSTNVGCVSSRAHTKVETGGGEFGVWLSARGLEWSDGTGWQDACPDFKVPDGADPGSAVLLNKANDFRLELYIGLERYDFYYHPEHLKDNKLKMLGPHLVTSPIVGATAYQGIAYRLRADGVVEWTGGDQAPGAMLADTGHLRGSTPFADIQALDIGLTHGAVDGTLTLRCDAAVIGKAPELGVDTNIPNPELDETGFAGISQRGNYLVVRLVAFGSNQWAIGPMWIHGESESGAVG